MSSTLCFMSSLSSELAEEMEFISLEDEGNELFITQESKAMEDSVVGHGILPEAMDFGAPLMSVVSEAKPQYSDISDDDFDFPSSQVVAEPNFE